MPIAREHCRAIHRFVCKFVDIDVYQIVIDLLTFLVWFLTSCKVRNVTASCNWSCLFMSRSVVTSLTLGGYFRHSLNFVTRFFAIFLQIMFTSRTARSWWRRWRRRVSCTRPRCTPTRTTTWPGRPLLVTTTERWPGSCRRNAGVEESHTRPNLSSPSRGTNKKLNRRTRKSGKTAHVVKLRTLLLYMMAPSSSSIRLHTHTHTHTHSYIYIYIYIYI